MLPSRTPLTATLRAGAWALAGLALAAGEALAAEPAGGAHAKPEVIVFQPNLAIWSLVVFVLLLLILWKFAWGPLSTALDRREEYMRNCMLEAEKARDEGRKVMAEYQEQMRQAADQVRAILEEARRDAQATKADILKTAEADAQAARQRAERDIVQMRAQLVEEIRTQTANLVVGVTGKLLTRELGHDDHRRLFDLALNELPAAQANGSTSGATA